MSNVEADDEELKMNKIRVKTDMVNLLQAGQRSGWTQQQPPPVGWLIINPGLVMAVSVVSDVKIQRQTGVGSTICNYNLILED